MSNGEIVGTLTTSELYQALRPAQRITALSALHAALGDEIKTEKDNLLAVAASVGVKSFTTEFGSVNVVQKDAPILINEFELLDYVKTSAPEMLETIVRVPDWYAAQLSDPKRLTVMDGMVLNEKGEVLPYASIGEAPAAHVAWPASKEQKAGKAQAVEFIHGNVGALSASVLGLDDVLAIAAPAAEPVAAPAAVVAPAVAEHAPYDLHVQSTF